MSRGVSLAGYQDVAECGSPAANAPPDCEICQPFSPRLPSSVPTGTPAYLTRVVNSAPSATAVPGVTTSSCLPARANFAALPSTSTALTFMPFRSRLNRSRSPVAFAVSVVSPSRLRDFGL